MDAQSCCLRLPLGTSGLPACGPREPQRSLIVRVVPLSALPVPLRRQLCVAFLMLCFVRVLLPEAWVLALHAHAHTTAEPALRAHLSPAKGKALLSGQHRHCHEDSLYDAAFQPAAPVLVLGPTRTAVVGLLTPFAASVWSEAEAVQRCLRGPPQA